jgi:hypothetical protein
MHPQIVSQLASQHIDEIRESATMAGYRSPNEAPSMNAQHDHTTPPRSGMRRLIAPWEFRHLRGSAGVHIAGGIVQAAAGVACLAYGIHGWAALFLVLGALNLAGGYWYLTIARSAPART